jgi:hypothetical protein
MLFLKVDKERNKQRNIKKRERQKRRQIYVNIISTEKNETKRERRIQGKEKM